MTDSLNRKDFLEVLKQTFPFEDKRDIDVSELKYVLYARKSTRNEERQERSIPDQIDDCMKREVIPNSLKVVGKPIEERCSAKEPDVRPKFREMLDDIQAGKINGVIAWHPDRLARNMKEAGEIIDLLDKGVLKDLRFATSTFENNPTGKMLLGISFVLSKQYSEHLSESVLRGNRRKTEDGVFFGKKKHGYFIGDYGKLFPDGKNFVLIKQAFEKRLEGVSQLEIANWLNTQGYTVRKSGKHPESYKWDKDSVSKMLRDPIYVGVLKYGRNLVDLTELYDFEPVIELKDFLKINRVKDLKDSRLVSSIMSKSRESVKADLLRGMVNCGYCDKPFSSTVTSRKLKGGKKSYYYYRCETAGCKFKNKAIRAKVVLDYASDFLSSHLFTTKNNYNNYVEEAKDRVDIKTKALASDVARHTKLVGDKKDEYERTKEAIRLNPGIAKHYNLDEVEKELKDLQKQLDDLIEARKHLRASILTYKQYLELFENIGVNLGKMTDMVMLDATLRKFFLNFTAKGPISGEKQGKITSHKLNEPWDGFVKTKDFDDGRGERT